MKSHVKSRTGQYRKMALALSLALGATQLHAGNVAEPNKDGPVAALMRHAAEAGIELPADLSKFEAYYLQEAEKSRAKNRAKNTHQVTNCSNSGPGSLAAAVYGAQSGDVIDLTGLNCDTINVTSSLVTNADDLTIQATGGGKYKIDGGNAVRPITHNGTGKLTLDGVSVVRGKVEADMAEGGCIKSRGEVVVRNGAQIKYCEANGRNAKGGGIFADKNVTFANGSRLAGNNVYGSNFAMGGGVYSMGRVFVQGAVVEKNKAKSSKNALGGGIKAVNLTAKYATVRDNKAFLDGTEILIGSGTAYGGGADLRGIAGLNIITRSTFSGNIVQANHPVNNRYSTVGGSAIRTATDGSVRSIIDSSTIANNASHGGTAAMGAVTVAQGNISITNSTISGNIEEVIHVTYAGEIKYGAGLTIVSNHVETKLESTIIAGNYREPIGGAGERVYSDIGSIQSNVPGNARRISGSKNFVNYHTPNIIWASDDNILEPLLYVDLGGLQDNGGLNHTMMPNDDSPVINGGAPQSNQTDQRGRGYARIHGPQADIGAVEWGSMRPEIFDDGFER